MKIFIDNLSELQDDEYELRQYVFRNGLITENLFDEIKENFSGTYLRQFHRKKTLRQIESSLVEDGELISIFPNIMGDEIKVRIYARKEIDYIIWMLESIFRVYFFHVKEGYYIEDPELFKVRQYALVFKKDTKKSIKDDITEMVMTLCDECYYKSDYERPLTIRGRNAAVLEFYERETGVKDLIMTIYGKRPKALGMTISKSLLAFYGFKLINAYPGEQYNGYDSYEFHLTNYK